jgi:LPXTG-motif cell wall-anchored protein
MVGLYQFSGGATSFSDFSVTGEISSVPSPTVGAGLPSLVMALGGLLVWRRRRNQGARCLRLDAYSIAGNTERPPLGGLLAHEFDARLMDWRGPFIPVATFRRRRYAKPQQAPAL